MEIKSNDRQWTSRQLQVRKPMKSPIQKALLLAQQGNFKEACEIILKIPSTKLVAKRRQVEEFYNEGKYEKAWNLLMRP